jgi:nucleoside-diphosphate-sugar epimerase
MITAPHRGCFANFQQSLAYFLREGRGNASKAALLLGWKARFGMHDIIKEMVAAELKL